MDPNLYEKRERDLFSFKSNKRKTPKNSKNTEDDDYFDGYADDDQYEDYKELNKRTNLFHQKLNANEVVKDGMFTYNHMPVGTVVAACITKVSTDALLVSLPFRLMGYVPLTQISSQYSHFLNKVASDQLMEDETFLTLPDLYRVGQFLYVCVSSSTSKKSSDGITQGLALNLYPNEVNNGVNCSLLKQGSVIQCSVSTVEDHGYVLDTGVKGVKAAFLPSENVPESLSLGVGSSIPCAVTKRIGDKTTATLTFTADPEAVATAASKRTGLLVPGSTIDCVVSKTSPAGLIVFVGTEEEFEQQVDEETQNVTQVGHVSKSHFRGPFDQAHLFRQKQKMQGKVLFITDFPKIIYITLNRNVMNYNLPEGYDPCFELVPQTVVEDASVLSYSQNGIYFRLSSKCLGYCHFKKLFRKGTTTNKARKGFIKKKYPEGSKVKCKIASFNHIDQVFLVNMSQLKENRGPAVDKPVLSIDQVMDVTINKYLNGIANVTTTKGNIQGFVRPNHLTNNKMQNPENKNPVGTTVRAKVIEINEKKYEDGGSKCSYYFTFKTQLVESQEPLLSKYSEENVGKSALGVVRYINTDNVVLVFGNNVRGLIPRSHIDSAYNKDDAFQENSVMRVVLSSLQTTGMPVYICDLTKRKRKNSGRDSHDDLVTKRNKIAEKNRESCSWLSSLKTLASPVKEQPAKEMQKDPSASTSLAFVRKPKNNKKLKAKKKVSKL